MQNRTLLYDETALIQIMYSLTIIPKTTTFLILFLKI